MNRVVVGVGSNISPVENITRAKAAFVKDHVVVAESMLMETAPIGFKNQPNFVNCAFLIDTPMNRQQLQKWLRATEDNLGRVRTENKYGPRTIDLDIVVWNNKIVDADIYEREFLRISVKQVLPELDI